MFIFFLPAPSLLPCALGLRARTAAWRVTPARPRLILPGSDATSHWLCPKRCPSRPVPRGPTASGQAQPTPSLVLAISTTSTQAHTHPLWGRTNNTTLRCPPRPVSRAGLGLHTWGCHIHLFLIPSAYSRSHRHSQVLRTSEQVTNIILNLFNVFITKRPTSVCHLIQQLEITILDESDTRQCFSSIQKLNSFNL